MTIRFFFVFLSQVIRDWLAAAETAMVQTYSQTPSATEKKWFFFHLLMFFWRHTIKNRIRFSFLKRWTRSFFRQTRTPQYCSLILVKHLWDKVEIHYLKLVSHIKDINITLFYIFSTILYFIVFQAVCGCISDFFKCLFTIEENIGSFWKKI